MEEIVLQRLVFAWNSFADWMSKVILGLGTEPGFDDHLNTYVSCWIKNKSWLQRNWWIQHTQIHLTLLLSFNFHLLVMSFLHMISQPSPRYPLTLPRKMCLVLASEVLMKIAHFWWEQCWGAGEDGHPTSPIFFNNSWRFFDYVWLIGAGTVNLQQVSCNNTLPQLVFVGLKKTCPISQWYNTKQIHVLSHVVVPPWFPPNLEDHSS